MYEVMARCLLDEKPARGTKAMAGKLLLPSAADFDRRVGFEIMSEGYRPPRPTSMDEGLYKLIEQCWKVGAPGSAQPFTQRLTSQSVWLRTDSLPYVPHPRKCMFYVCP